MDQKKVGLNDTLCMYYGIPREYFEKNNLIITGLAINTHGLMIIENESNKLIGQYKWFDELSRWLVTWTNPTMLKEVFNDYIELDNGHYARHFVLGMTSNHLPMVAILRDKIRAGLDCYLIAIMELSDLNPNDYPYRIDQFDGPHHENDHFTITCKDNGSLQSFQGAIEFLKQMSE